MFDLEFIKIIIVAICLVYASYSDIRRGEVSNKVWSFLIIVGLVFLITDFVFVPLLCSIIMMSIIMFAFYRFEWFAGADVKAMLCLSILYPYFINPTSLPSFPSSFCFPLLPFPITALNILFFSSLSGALYTIFTRKKGGIPFLPHITIGWIVVLIIESFI